MRIGRRIKYFALLVAGIAVLCPVVLYILAGGAPARYQPALLTQVQQKQAAGQFLMKIQEFGNLAQSGTEFTWSISQEECNDALASLGEIADKLQQGKAGQVRQAMERSGATDPAVAFDDGLLTIMLKAKEYDKIVSIDVRFTFDQQKQLLVRFAGARVGLLPMPDGLARNYLEQFQRAMEHRPAQPASDGTADTTPSGGSIGGVSANDLSAVLAGVIQAIDGLPLPADRTWKINHQRFRIAGIQMDKGKLALQVEPVAQAKKARSTSTKNTPIINQ
jgi:hypothetical protein